MRGWIGLTLAAVPDAKVRISVDHIVRYGLTAREEDKAQSSVGLVTGGSLRVLETAAEIDALLEDAG